MEKRVAKNVEEKPACQYVYSRGIMAGSQCGRPAANGKDNLCWQHKHRDIKQLITINAHVAAKTLMKEHKKTKAMLLRLNEQAQEIIDVYRNQDVLTAVEQDTIEELKALINSVVIKRL